MMKLYYLNCNKLSQDIFLSLGESLEEHRLSRLARAKDESTKTEIIATDALLKYALAKELDVSPCTVRSKYKDSGEPYIVGLPVNVSISHSCLHIIVSLSKEKTGVDIECLRRIDFKKLSERYFFDGEKKRIENSDDKIRTFFSVWTAKEACFKCSNDRFASPLSVDSSKEKVSVTLEYDGCIVSAVGENDCELVELTGEDVRSLIRKP